MSPEISRRLERLVADYAEGWYADEDFALRLGELAAGCGLGALTERLPPDLHWAARRGIALDNRRAADRECLRPEDSPFHWPGGYYHRVAETLLEPDEPGRRGRLSVVCLPSFEAEWALRLLGSDRVGFSLALSVAADQIYGHSSGPVGARRAEAPLEVELAVLVCEAWRKMLSRTRHPEMVSAGLDGVAYHFTSHGPGVGFMAGRTQDVVAERPDRPRPAGGVGASSPPVCGGG
jgi:hypothetical protein